MEESNFIFFSCDICSQKFKNKNNYENHLNFHEEGTYLCWICPSKKTYKSKSTLYLHMRTKHTEEKFECNDCKLKFQFKHSLEYHINKVHLKIKPYACDKCSKSFYNQPSWLLHWKTHFVQYTCSVCQQKFKHQNNLSRHRQKHTERRTFECDLCKKTFSRKSGLKVHIEKHIEDKHFECTICNKTFLYKSTLNMHMNIHKEKSSHECQLCNNRYNDPASLRYHLNAHLNKRFECILCQKTYSSQYNLARHNKKFHVDGVLYCDECNKTFNGREKLKKHKCPGSPAYLCEYCPRKFLSLRGLKYHSSLQHELNDLKSI